MSLISNNSRYNNSSVFFNTPPKTSPYFSYCFKGIPQVTARVSIFQRIVHYITVSIINTLLHGGSFSQALDNGLKGAFAGAITGGIAGQYGNTWNARVSIFQRIVHYITVSIITLCVIWRLNIGISTEESSNL
jgi:hypothetical protein